MSGTFVETFWRDIIARYPTWMLDTVGMLLWHEAIYFGAAIPFILMDCVPALRKYKIQKVRKGKNVFFCFSLFFDQPSISDHHAPPARRRLNVSLCINLGFCEYF
jgi:hypothetical protein